MQKEYFGLKVYQLIIILIVAILITLTYQIISADKPKEEIREPIINDVVVVEEEIEMTPGIQSIADMNQLISEVLDVMYRPLMILFPLIAITTAMRIFSELR